MGRTKIEGEAERLRLVRELPIEGGDGFSIELGDSGALEISYGIFDEPMPLVDMLDFLARSAPELLHAALAREG